MGLASLEKATLLLYEDDRKEFLEELQDMGILHIANSRLSSLAEEYPDLLPEREQIDEEAEEIFQELGKVIEILKPHTDGRGLLGQFIDLKTALSADEYRSAVKSFKRAEIKDICTRDERRYHLKNKLTELKEKKAFYEVWIKIRVPISELEALENVIVKVYKIKAKKDEIKETIKDIPVDYTIIFENGMSTGVLFIIYKGFEQEFEETLQNFDAELVDFGEEKRVPREIVSKCKSEIKKIEKEISTLSNWITEKSVEFDRFLVLYDYFLSRIKRTDVLNRALTTRQAFFIEGWIDRKDKHVLESLVSSHSGVDLKWSKTRKEEKPPVKLKNNKLAEPYEVLTGLYALPKSNEIDPSPYVGLFFGLFFAFCLTDAVYGLALAIIGIILMPRLPEGRKYLWIFIVGGIFTVFAGAMTGGWLGDIDRLFPALSPFRHRFMIFDPFENPLYFLYLSLGFGAVQILTGLLISVKEKFRKKEYLDAFANEISWIVFFIFIIISRTTGVKMFNYLIPLPLLMILLFSWRSNSWIKQIAKGGFRLFRGLVGFLGDILSYSRIMALGLVTAGLAMSVNVLTGLVKEFPVIGPVLAVFVFIGGHIFSLAINTLSGFVHTMRLQFAEFFSYFYEGGGEKFEPFGLAGTYTRIKD